MTGRLGGYESLGEESLIDYENNAGASPGGTYQNSETPVKSAAGTAAVATQWTLAGGIFGGAALLFALAGLAMLGLTDKGQSLISNTLNRHSSTSGSSSSGSDLPYGADVSSNTTSGDDTIGDDTDVIVYAAYDTTELGFQRRGYSKLPYWGSDGSPADEVVMYQFLRKYDSLIEPNADMHFGYVGDDEEDDSSLDYYTYAVYDDSENNELLGSGAYYMCKGSRGISTDVSVDCSPFDELRIDVRRLDKSGNELFAFNMSAVCMYVRRELRSLADSDLNRTMDAMYAMWSVSDEEGQKLYGENFHSSSWFAGMHDFNAAWSDGDHIHEGLGFLPQHMKMTNIFEASMQAVDPSVSLFYWDFTIESTLSESFYSSPMFQSDTFGSLTYSAQDGTAYAWSYTYDKIEDSYIPDGRWANIKANINSFEDLASPFGYMRGPWNANPAPKITRFAQDDLMLQNIPSCKVYLQWLEMDDFGDFLSNSENAPHASIHGGIGGVFGCDVLDELYDKGYIGVDEDGEDYREDICYKWPFYMKELYRGDILRFREDCTTDHDLSFAGTRCGYVCNEEKIDSVGDILSGLSLANYVTNSSDPTLWEAFKDFVCTGNAYRIFSGDHLESASPADPSFWPIHPTQERLFHAKMMAGGFNSWQWPNVTGQSTPKITYEWVCNHAECYDYTDTSDDKEKDYFVGCCAGHFGEDQLFDFESGDRGLSYGATNSQILADSDPTSDDYAVPYIYDNFDWSHCSKLAGYDIKSKMTELFENTTDLIGIKKPWE